MPSRSEIIRAERDPRYYLRFVLIAAVMGGFCLWSLYDGLIAYPKESERAAAYLELEEELAEKRELSQLTKEWTKLATERDWPTDEPHDDVDIIKQYVMAGVTGLIAAWLLFFVWRSRGRWIEVGQSGLTSSWGQTVDFHDVVSLDKRVWRKKGIAKVNYTDGGRRRRFVIDDYKFHREPTDEILRRLEAEIGEEKIIGGPPEAAVEEAAHV
jgi:hypothetical protein